MDISVVGISHHTADLVVREAFALSGDLVQQLLRALQADDLFAEALVLDTCNRTEVYFVSRSNEASLDRLLGHISRIKGIPPITDTSGFYRWDGPAAVEHLFRVAAALDSQIVGEHQILGQLKNAYRLAFEEGTAGFLINKLLHWAFRTGKRSRSETDLGSGSTSIAQAAVDLSQQVFTNLTGKTVMLVGAGRTGELAAKAMVRCGVGSVIVANRSIDRAKAVTTKILHMQPEDKVELDVLDPGPRSRRSPKRCRPGEPDVPCGRNSTAQMSNVPTMQAIPLDKIPEVIDEVDLMICATGSSDLVLTDENLGKVIAKSHRSLFIIDIAVPRDVDPNLGHLPNVFLYNIEDLDKIVVQNIEVRQKEIPRVEAIIADEVDSFAKWFSSLEVAPTIKLLQQRFSMVRNAEIKRYGKMFAQTDLEQLEKFTEGLCGKILHQPIAFLHELSAETPSNDQLAAVDLIRRIFRLDELEQDT